MTTIGMEMPVSERIQEWYKREIQELSEGVSRSASMAMYDSVESRESESATLRTAASLGLLPSAYYGKKLEESELPTDAWIRESVKEIFERLKADVAEMEAAVNNLSISLDALERSLNAPQVRSRLLSKPFRHRQECKEYRSYLERRIRELKSQGL